MAIRQFITLIPLVPFALALFCVGSPLLQAQPRLMADEEMDQVCAKGSAGPSVDPVVLNQMIFNFSRQTSLGQVSGSGAITVEALPNTSGKSQILVGPTPPVAGGTPIAAGSTPITIPTTDLQVVNGTVRVSGDLNITLQTLPGVMHTLQQNRPMLPTGFNSLAGTLQGIGGMR